MSYPLAGKRVFVSGHRGMVGSAIVRRLATEGCTILTADRSIDLREQAEVRDWFAANAPDTVIVAAGKVGGILANDSLPAQFLYDNLMIEANLVEASRQADWASCCSSARRASIRSWPSSRSSRKRS